MCPMCPKHLPKGMKGFTKMKMKAQEFKQFETHLLNFLKQHPEFVRKPNWNSVRWQWEVYHACNESTLPEKFLLRPLVAGLNDNHIDTALRKVFAE